MCRTPRPGHGEIGQMSRMRTGSGNKAESSKQPASQPASPAPSGTGGRPARHSDLAPLPRPSIPRPCDAVGYLLGLPRRQLGSLAGWREQRFKQHRGHRNRRLFRRLFRVRQRGAIVVIVRPLTLFRRPDSVRAPFGERGSGIGVAQLGPRFPVGRSGSNLV